MLTKEYSSETSQNYTKSAICPKFLKHIELSIMRTHKCYYIVAIALILYRASIIIYLCASMFRLSDNQGISPALFARSLLQGAYSDPTMAKKCFKDTTLIEDKDLAYQVFLVTTNILL